VSVRFAEPIAALRRIPVYLVDAAGVPVTGVVPVGAELQISKAGSAWGVGGGTWSELGLGLYAYEATLAEATTTSFLLLRVAVAAARPYVYATDIGDRISPTAAANERRVPIYLVDGLGDPAPGVDISVVADNVTLTVAGGALTDGAGLLVEIGLGAYYYELDATELVEGAGVLRFEDVVDAVAQVYVYTWDVRPAGTPLAVVTEPLKVPADVTEQVTTIDHVTEALRRLPHQFRGSTGR
jgi:hypothetical protein